MQTTHRLIITALAALTGALPLAATQPTKQAQPSQQTGDTPSLRLTLSQCLEQAATGNLQVKAGEIAVSKARALQGTAVDLEKTSVALSQDATAGGGPDNGITVSQTIAFPTVYAARRRYLKAETEMAQKQLALTRCDLEREVSAAYYTLLYTTRAVQILQRQDSTCRRFVQLATAKWQAGESSQLEQMNAQRLCNENLMRLQKAQSDCAQASMSLQTLIGTDARIVPADTLAPATAPAGAPLAFGQTAAGQLQTASVTAAEQALRVARQGYMPDISVGLTGQLVIGGFNPYDVDRSRFEKGNLMAFEVGVAVPIFYGAQRARVKAARHDVELAATQRQQAERQAQGRYERARSEYARAQQALAYYDQEGRRQALHMARLAQISYENGEIGYVEYMQNLQTALDVQLQYANAVNEYNQAVVELNYITANK